MGSLLNEFTIMRKTLRVLLDGVFGNEIMNLSTRAQNAGIASNSKAYERELLPYGDPRKLPPGFNARTQGIFQYWVEDGTFVKLRELSASYTLDRPPCGACSTTASTSRCPAAICAVWTNYSGYDPEINLFGTNAGGVRLGADDGRRSRLRLRRLSHSARVVVERALHLLTCGDDDHAQ